MNELHLFAGAGGGILGGILLGHTCVCAVEIEPYCRKVLLQRQRDGILPKFPIWDDVRTFDGRPWHGLVDCVCGGFPCKGISVAGSGTGLDHEESGLWREQARIIGEIRPAYIFVENSPALTVRGGVRVLGDLAALGYDCRWGIISAADAIWSFGTPCIDHLRERIWIVANRPDADSINHDYRGRGAGEIFRERPQAANLPEREASPDADLSGRFAFGICAESPDTGQSVLEKRNQPPGERAYPATGSGSWWAVEPRLGRVVNELANRMDGAGAYPNIGL